MQTIHYKKHGGLGRFNTRILPKTTSCLNWWVSERLFRINRRAAQFLGERLLSERLLLLVLLVGSC